MHTHTSRILFSTLFAGLVALSASACSSTSSNAADDTELRAAVAKTYAVNASIGYAETVSAVKDLKAAVDAFVASPSQASLDAAREAWMTALPIYNRTEVYRFYGGPIDNDETGPEGMINGWPLDENFVDYTKDQPNAGIINDPTNFPEITKEVIRDENEKGGEKNLSSGFHAVEFLLWGQDQNSDGPGNRPYTDYVTGEGGTAANQDRRGAYLKAVTEMLVDDLEPVEKAWDLKDPESYGSKWIAGDPTEAITNMLKGMGSLAGGELGKERMDNAYETKEQEEEHSCFSDTTLDNLYNDAVGIKNAYLGTSSNGKAADGDVGLDALVKAKDAALDEKVKADLEAVLSAIKAIPAPFDQAILGNDDSEGRTKIKEAIDACSTLAGSIADVADLLGIKINFE